MTTDKPGEAELPPEAVTVLESATERLADQVAALSGALQAIGQLQEEQVELTRKVEAVKEDLTENAVPKHEFTAAQAEGVAARQRLQTRIRIFAIGTACLALIVSIAAGFVSYETSKAQAEQSFKDAQKARLALCTERNREAVLNTQKSKEFFAPYIVQEEHNPHGDPVLLAILKVIADTPPNLITCQ